MQTTKFKTKVHKCSVCDYKSLIKTQVQNHLKRCKDAKVITEDTIVSHYDEHDTEKLSATLYQCSKCSYTSSQPGCLHRHLTKKCEGDMLSSKRILSFSHVPEEFERNKTGPPEFYGPKLPPGGLQRALKGRDIVKIGVLYLIIPDGYDIIKFGRWSGTMSALKGRYSTYYITYDIITREFDDIVIAEKKFKKILDDHALRNNTKELIVKNQMIIDLFNQMTI